MAIQTATGSIVSATGTLVCPLSGDPYVFAAVTGTYTGVSFVFEASNDGTNYYPVQAIQTDTWMPYVGTITPGTNTSRAWYIIVGPATQLRLRATAWSTGSMTVVLTSAPSAPPVVGALGMQLTTTSGRKAVAVASAAGATVISATPAILHRIICTTAGTASLAVYDNASAASGTKLYATVASLALGTVQEVNAPAANGLTTDSPASSAAVTFVYTPLNAGL